MRAVLLVILLPLVTGHAHFANQLPNGGGVPNPCGTGFWQPVGHYSATSHTRIKNQFALDFRSEGNRWTQRLCRHDSDWDGQSNGQELGDPDCTWRVGMAVTRQASGHPGVCEPVNSPLCQYRLRQNGMTFNCRRCLNNPGTCNMPGGPR